ncbi:MAG: hypothetical protein DHS20C02_17260 [Micavibrio sp.]|nr:MAG: hypothetical protein DHS20C02_17260 [Micavibrio sp.]
MQQIQVKFRNAHDDGFQGGLTLNTIRAFPGVRDIHFSSKLTEDPENIQHDLCTLRIDKRANSSKLVARIVELPSVERVSNMDLELLG